jgi:hypothetical protein
MNEVKGNSFKRFKEFIKSKLFLKHFSLSIVVGIGLIFVIFQSLGTCTHHGEGLSVPDFSGLSLKKAIKLAKGKKPKTIYHGFGR